MSEMESAAAGSVPSPRLLVVGCGAIGSVVAANLANLGANLTILSRNEAIADAINARGVIVQGDSPLGRVDASVVTTLEGNERPFDAILLAVQPPQVEDAARRVVGHLAHDGVLVCLQNGLCELRLTEIAGPERVVGAIVSWGASMVEPGVVDRTSSGGFVLGRLDGAIDERLVMLGHLLESTGPVTLTSNLLGARWSKLALNCAVSALGTLGGDRLGPLLAHRFVRRLALEIMTEAVEVARAEGVTLEKVAGTLDLEWLALGPSERDARLGSPLLVTKHALLLAVGTRYRRLRSSMLQAIERGQPPAVDFLNGEVIERGRARGVLTPVNSAVHDAIWQLARGEERPSLRALESLYLATREVRVATVRHEP